MSGADAKMDALELTRRLIRCRSVTPDDAGCQPLIASLLEPVGFVAEHLRFGDVDNLWIRRGSEGPLLVFAGHTDVVPSGPVDEWRVEPFAADVRDGVLTGRGAADMKSGLAAMIKACERFVTTYPDHPGSIAMLITSDEEGAADDGTLKVMETLAARNELPDWCVVGEPSSNEQLGDTVRIGRRGSLTGLMTVRGTQGHVAYPLPRENPIHALSRFVAEFTREPVDHGNAHFPPTTFQMVNVHCDAGAPNVVPGELACRFNLRYSTEWTQHTLAAHVEGVLKRLGIDYQIRWRNAGMPFITEPGVLTNAVTQAVREETGLTPELSTSGGTSDGRFIAPYGVQVVELGPLNRTIHKINEEIAVADIDRMEKIFFRIAQLLLRPSQRA